MKNKAKTTKIIRSVLLAVLAVLFVIVSGTYIFHKIKTAQEIKLLKANGYYNPVSVGDHSLNVAIFGKRDGEHTIVSLAGLGMADYSVTERRMTACLEKENTVVFIDRAGYGLSDDTDNEMTIDYIVEDYRKALNNAGVKAPYVLMPHSIGGAYASYWVSKYPDEIEAIVFLDGTQLSDDMGLEEIEIGFGDKAEVFLAKLGFGRYMLRKECFLYPNGFTEEEQNMGDALNLMSMDSYACLSENDFHNQNLMDAWNGIITNDVPKLYVCASWGFQNVDELIENSLWLNNQIVKNHIDTKLRPTEYEGNEYYFDTMLAQCEDARNTKLIPYLEKMGNCELVLLGGDHAIYEQRPEECGDIVLEFINGLDVD